MSMAVEITHGAVKNYINGRFVEAENAEFLDVENPSTGEIIGRVPLSSPAEVKHTVDVAQEAYRDWSRTPVGRRVSYLFRLNEAMRAHEEELARQIAEENGKSIPDAVAEMKRAIENVEVACAMPVLQQGDNIIGSSFEIDGEVIRLPLGVFGMIAPFNFPAMVPFWFLPYAIATGNTFIVKPSQQVPFTIQRIAELVDEIGLPPGVFNVVHGDGRTGSSLIEDRRVKGVSLVGSSAVARQVAAQCAQAGKRFQAMGGAKNHLVVLPDARVDDVVRNMITSCYGCAGQRCMAASAIVCVGDDMYRVVTERFVEASKKVLVADPLDPDVADERMVMGPVISAQAKQRILGLIQDGIDEGATLALDGRDLVVPSKEQGHYIGPTVFVDVKPGMKIHRTEIFGPVVVILKAQTLDEAIQIINNHEYGNGASIYTQDGYSARKFKIEAEAGMIGINVGIPAPVAYLPFGGMKSSQFSHIKAQGKAVINFFTEDKIITERYWQP
jgi:malonate-semialdehyde dehydrogenase (acetylating)/methylmalonate-semialdehyde dehydrogenase